MFIKIATTDHGPLSAITGHSEHEGYCVTAQTPEGEVYIHERRDLNEEDARYLANVVGRAKQITPERWTFWRTVYGSDAFLQEQEEACAAANMIRLGLAGEEDFDGTYIGEMI